MDAEVIPTLLHSFDASLQHIGLSDYPVLPCVDRQTKVKRGPWMQLALTETHTHPYTTRFDDYAPARAGRRTPSTSRNTTLPRSSGKRVIETTNLVSQALEGEPQLVVPNPLEVLSPLLPLGPPHTKKVGDGTFKKIGIDWNSSFRLLDHCFTKAKLHGLSYGLSQCGLMVCYSTLPQSLPHCLRQASDSTSG